ncbi:hypothetical protein E5Z02_20045, partial [Streptomyces rhizosphaericola]
PAPAPHGRRRPGRGGPAPRPVRSPAPARGGPAPASYGHRSPGPGVTLGEPGRRAVSAPL